LAAIKWIGRRGRRPQGDRPVCCRQRNRL